MDWQVLRRCKNAAAVKIILKSQHALFNGFILYSSFRLLLIPKPIRSFCIIKQFNDLFIHIWDNQMASLMLNDNVKIIPSNCIESATEPTPTLKASLSDLVTFSYFPWTRLQFPSSPSPSQQPSNGNFQFTNNSFCALFELYIEQRRRISIALSIPCTIRLLQIVFAHKLPLRNCTRLIVQFLCILPRNS